MFTTTITSGGMMIGVKRGLGPLMMLLLLPSPSYADDRSELPIAPHVVGGFEVGLASETVSIGFRGMLLGAKPFGTTDVRPVVGAGVVLGGGGVYPNSEHVWTKYWSAGPALLVGLQMMDGDRRDLFVFATAAYLRTGVDSHNNTAMPAVVGSDGWRASIGVNAWYRMTNAIRHGTDENIRVIPDHLELVIEDDVGTRRVGGVFGYGF
jgi:hypothetical protein